MDRLAILGWDPEAAPLLEALESEARLRPVAAGDRSAARLVRARGALGLPCYQHVGEMAARVECDAALLLTAQAVEDAADAFAARGADLVLTGAAAGGPMLRHAVDAARRHGVALVVLRPELPLAAVAAVRAHLEAEGARGRFLSATLRSPAHRAAPLDLGIALLLVTMDGMPARVAAAGDAGGAVALLASYEDGCAASLTVGSGDAFELRATLETAAGPLELIAGGGASDVWTADGRPLRLEEGASLAREARRVAAVRAGAADDSAAAMAHATLDAAVGHALRTGLTVPTRPEPGRPALRLIEGGATEHRASAARGRLRLVAG